MDENLKRGEWLIGNITAVHQATTVSSGGRRYKLPAPRFSALLLNFVLFQVTGAMLVAGPTVMHQHLGMRRPDNKVDDADDGREQRGSIGERLEETR